MLLIPLILHPHTGSRSDSVVIQKVCLHGALQRRFLGILAFVGQKFPKHPLFGLTAVLIHSGHLKQLLKTEDIAAFLQNILQMG